SDEFSMGRKARRDIIGDTGPNHYSRWDPIWNSEEHGETQHVHILISINGKTEEVVESRYRQIEQILSGAIAKCPDIKHPGVTQLTGHRGAGVDNLPYQPSAALANRFTTEHFGYSNRTSGTLLPECCEAPRT